MDIQCCINLDSFKTGHKIIDISASTQADPSISLGALF